MNAFNQRRKLLINSIDTVVNTTNVKNISNIQILTHCIATIPTRLTGRCIAPTSCILEVEIDEVAFIQNPQLVMTAVAHLKDEVESV